MERHAAAPNFENLDGISGWRQLDANPASFTIAARRLRDVRPYQTGDAQVRGAEIPGIVTGIWLIWYAIARTICEFFRDPEPVHVLNIGPFTAGQMYSIPMVLLGLWFIWRARRGAAQTATA